jgi:hypothetical protein
MRRTATIFLTLLGLTGLAQAAELTNESAAGTTAPVEGAYYRWIDASGRVQYSDFEPEGVSSERVELAPEPAEAGTMILEAAGEGASDAFRDQDDQILPIEHIGPCADARRHLAILHSSLPVYRTDSGAYRNAWRGDTYQGERRYLDADERMSAITDARAEVLSACSDPEAFEREIEAFRARVER